jgi:hypothetical protein
MNRNVTLNNVASITVPPAANPRPYFPNSFAVTDCAAGLERIFDDGVSVCIWHRPVDIAIYTYLDKAMPTVAPERTARVSTADPRFDELLAGLHGAPDPSSFVFELCGLVDLFSSLTGADSIGVRLFCGNTRPCPRFHVDRLGLRMVCTWRGPGTEWIEHGAVNRQFFAGSANRPPDEHSGLLPPGAQVHQMRPFDIGVFKGELWPNNGNRGAVHRSPRLPPLASPRVMVTLDAL